MKQYRFQAWAAGFKIDSTVSADNDTDAINSFCKSLNSGSYNIVEDGFRNTSQHGFYVTYEEM
jgi:hypothetical protein